MFRQFFAVALLAVSIAAPFQAMADSSAPLPTGGPTNSGGGSGDCEFVEGLNWDDDANDYISWFFLECS